MEKFVLDYRVPYGDTDCMGVVYYANYLTIFERARNEMLRYIGYSYKQFESEGFGLPVAKAECNYRAPARYDDLLQVSAWCSKISNAKAIINCEIHCNGKLLAEGYTVHACIELKSGKICRFPSEFANTMREFDND